MKKITKEIHELRKEMKENLIKYNKGKCQRCGNLASDMHEVFAGTHRNASVALGYVFLVCRKCHIILDNKKENIKLCESLGLDYSEMEKKVKSFYFKAINTLGES